MRDPQRLLDFARRLAQAGFDLDALTYWLTAFVQTLIPHAGVHITVRAPDGTLDEPPAAHTHYELRANDRDVGILSVDAPREQIDQADEEIRIALDFFAPAVAAAISLREIETRVVRDALTGLYNRNYALVRLEEEISRARRRNSGVCVLLLDIHGMAQINKTYGFQTGDAAIRMAAHALRAACRNSDLVCRYEADRFVLIYVDVDASSSVPMTRRAREQVESRVLPVPGGAIGLQTSAGAAMFGEDTPDAPALIAKAEADLRRDKRERKT